MTLGELQNTYSLNVSVISPFFGRAQRHPEAGRNKSWICNSRREEAEPGSEDVSIAINLLGIVQPTAAAAAFIALCFMTMFILLENSSRRLLTWVFYRDSTGRDSFRECSPASPSMSTWRKRWWCTAPLTLRRWTRCFPSTASGQSQSILCL